MFHNKTILPLYVSCTDAFIFYVLILVYTNVILSCLSLMLAGDLCQQLPLGVKLRLLCRCKGIAPLWEVTFISLLSR